MGQYVEADAWMVTARGYGPRTYRAFVPHPLSGWDPVLSVEDLDAASAGDRALGAIASLPRTGLGGAIADWMAARDESIRSSIIEGVASTEPGLAWARYMDAAGRPVSDHNDALTLGAVRQLTFAVALGSKMRGGDACRIGDILEMHETLFSGTRDRGMGGVLRDEPIWVGPPGCLVDDATFVAPPPDRVPELMADLVDYLNASTHHPVLKAAVAHAQFESIHPFEDGNGRAGRAIIHTVLNAAGAARGAVPISTTLSHDRQRYYDALNAMHVECAREDTLARTAAVRPWLTVLSGACQDAARHAAASSRRVEGIAARWHAAGRFRSGSAASRLLAELPSMPVLDTEMAARRLGITPKSARRAVAALESAGVVSGIGGRRNRRYWVPDLVGLMQQVDPDGGPPIHGWTPQRQHPRAEPATPDQAQQPTQQCPHYGARSGRRCRLPVGHAGQHRYPPDP